MRQRGKRLAAEDSQLRPRVSCTTQTLVSLGGASPPLQATPVALPAQIGPNKNQAFVEFADIQQSIAIVSHFQRGSEPAKVGRCA